jgi:hypothetical protein
MPFGFAFKALTGQAAVDGYCNIWDYEPLKIFKISPKYLIGYNLKEVR